MASRQLHSGELASVLPPGGLTLVSSCSAESDLLAREVSIAGDALGSMTFTGVFVPGLNRQTWRSGAETRVETFFQTAELKREGDRARFVPLCYEDIISRMRASPPRAALFMCSPPDDEGMCSFGTEVAFAAALWPKIPVRIGHINPQMPRTPGDPGIPFSELTGWFEGEQPLRGQEPGSADLVSEAIGRQIAALVPDGATIQAGLGKVPDAALRALRDHSVLRLHTGLIGDGALDLIRSGAMDSGASATVGVAIGSLDLYAGLDHEHLQFRPVTVTHDPAKLAGIDRLVTINSAMEVDLFGQAYAEASSRGFLSGPGGASDYARGARQSRGGLRIVALPSTAGPISRIVPPGSGSGPVSLSRFDIDIVVTEHGFADLRGKDYHERAAALIAISAPQNRDDLSREWTTIAKLI